MTHALANFSKELAERVKRAGAMIVSVNSHRTQSSGFVWKPGFVVTSDEALAEEGDVSVTLPGGEEVKAEVVGRDPSTAVALLKLAKAMSQPPALTAAAAPEVGSLVLAVGAADGDTVAALGIVSRAGGAWRSMRGGEIDQRIELDVKLRRAAEGGLALTAEGEVLGMCVFGPRRRSLVIPLGTVERSAARLETHGRVARGYLGLGLQPVSVDGGAGTGAMVMNVDPAGPAASAGFQQGDIVVTWNGEPIKRPRGMLRALGPDSVGQTVQLGVRRGGALQTLPLTIQERPAA
jgi:S1-C subfamily serine protease